MTDRYPIGEVLASGSKVVTGQDYYSYEWPNSTEEVDPGDAVGAGVCSGEDQELLNAIFMYDVEVAGSYATREITGTWYFWGDWREENLAWQIFQAGASATISLVTIGLWRHWRDDWIWEEIPITAIDLVEGEYYAILVYGAEPVEGGLGEMVGTIQVEIKAAGNIPIETLPATRVSNLNATLNGNYPGSQSAQLYFEIRNVELSFDTVTMFVRLGANVSYSSCVAGLTPLTLYSYRAIAKIGTMSYFGEWVEFTTVDEPLYPIIPDDPTYTTDPDKFTLVPKRKLDL